MAARLRALRLPPGKGRRWSRLTWLAALGGAGAACLWLALTVMFTQGRQEALAPDGQTPSGPPLVDASPRGEAMEAFPVATAAEVEILSVQGEDTATLVVGELPVEGSLLLLQADELTLTNVEPAHDNMVPEIRKGGSAFMIVAPLDVEREDPEETNQG